MGSTKLTRGFNPIVGRHYAMERFCIGLVAIIVALGLLVVFCIGSIQKQNEQLFADKALYTTSVQGSVSGVKAEVVSLAESHNRTRCALILKFDDPLSVPAHTDGWRVHVTGMNPDQSMRSITTGMNGAFVQYGTSGYAAVCLSQSQPFVSELVYIGLEAVSDTGARSSSSSETQTGSHSDRFEFIINPGANQAMPCSALDDGFDTVDLISTMVVDKAETEAKDKIRESVTKLRTERIAIDDALDRLADYGLDVSSMPPDVIKADVFKEREDGTIDYRCGKNVEGAIVIDWENCSISDEGYTSNGKVSGVDLETFISDYSKNNKAKSKQDSLSHSWMFTDGRSLLDVSSSSESSRVTDIKEVVSKLDTSMQSYLNEKVTLQTTEMLKLLELEQELKDITNNIEHSEGIDVR